MADHTALLQLQRPRLLLSHRIHFIITRANEGLVGRPLQNSRSHNRRKGEMGVD